MANNRQGNRNPKSERERQLDKAVKAAVEGPRLGSRKAAQPQKLRRPNREMKKTAEADKAVREVQHNLRVQRQQKPPQTEAAQPVPVRKPQRSAGSSRGKLRIIPLGGLGEIGKNMTVYEFGNDIIVVDCGMGFPDDDMYGIDAVIPDVTYLEENASRIRGIFITHGHEDHIGAVPYVMKKLHVPIYTCRLTAALIRLKLEEHRILKQTELHIVEPGQTVEAGCFSVEFIHINHSIADAVAFAIRTPLGVIVHTGDYKIDVTPVTGGMADLVRLGQLGNEGVLALMPESTNIEKPGHSESERSVGEKFDELFKDCDKRIIVTTFASNIGRIQQIINAAARVKRKVGITGRSMENIMRVSRELGYMQIPEGTLVDMDKIKAVPKNKTVIITTGSQGEEMSALHRMAFSEHKQVDIDANDLIIMSSSAIPGNEITVSRVIDELFAKGAQVIYGRGDHLHVSGHACREEMKMMIALTKPKFVIPIHGETRMLYQHAKLAREMGVDAKHVLVSGIGHVIEMTQKTVKENGEVPSGQVLVDGAGVGDVGSVVLRDRKHLADEGMIVVILSMSAESGAIVSEPEIVTRGFVYLKEADDLMNEMKRVVNESIRACELQRIRDFAGIKGKVKANLNGFLYKTVRRSPMILPVIIEV